MKKKLGTHLICEATGCKSSILDDEIFIVDVLLEACNKSKATILGHLQHKFEPQGVTVVIGLAESHLSIHTWPEDNYAMLDIATCGKMNPYKILKYIKKKFNCNMDIIEMDRGIPQ